MTETNWPSEWMRGPLALCVLAVIARHGAGTHGYAIAQALAAAGLGTVKGGTIYPLLGRLEEDGLVTASWLPGDGGPGRKVFALTPGGRRHLTAELPRWREFTMLTTHLIAEADAR